LLALYTQVAHFSPPLSFVYDIVCQKVSVGCAASCILCPWH